MLSQVWNGAVPRGGARIVAHHGGSHRIGANRVQAGDEHAGLHQANAADPGPLAAGDGLHAVDDGEVNGPRRHDIGHDVRNAIAGVVVDAEVQLLRRGFRRLPAAFVPMCASARRWGFSLGSSTPASSP